MTIKLTRPRPRQILLLETNPGLAHALELMLRQAGLRVTVCTVDAEMVEQLRPDRLRATGIDLVLVDLDGSTTEDEKFLSCLQTAAALLPMIVIAPYGQEGTRGLLGDQPGCHFLTSPLDPEELLSCLTQATDMHQAIEVNSAITANLKGGKTCKSKN